MIGTYFLTFNFHFHLHNYFLIKTDETFLLEECVEIEDKFPQNMFFRS